VVDIINDYAQFISNDAFQNGLTSLMTSPTGTTNPVQLTFFSEMGNVFGIDQRYMSMANAMVAMTPLLTLSILTGSYYAMAQLAKGMTSDQSLNKAQDVATPNLGATNYNQGVNGYGMQSSQNGVIGANNALAQDSATVTSGGTLSAASSAQSAASIKSADSAASAREKMMNTTADMTSALKHDQNMASGLTAQDSHKLDAAQKQLEQFGHGDDLSTAQKRQVVASIAGGLSLDGALGKLASEGPAGAAAANTLGKALGIKADAGIKGSYTGEHSAAAKQFIKEAHDVAASQDQAATLLSSLGYTTSAGSSQAQSLKQNLGDAKKYQAQASEEAARAEQYQQAAQSSASEGGAFSYNGAKMSALINSRYGNGRMALGAAESLGTPFTGALQKVFSAQQKIARLGGASQIQANTTAFANTMAYANQMAQHDPQYANEAVAAQQHMLSVIPGLTSDSGGVGGAPGTLATAKSQTGGAPALPSSATAVTDGVHQQVRHRAVRLGGIASDAARG
jgi:conjugal transfer mating pair stabilization protein TraG